MLFVYSRGWPLEGGAAIAAVELSAAHVWDMLRDRHHPWPAVSMHWHRGLHNLNLNLSLSLFAAWAGGSVLVEALHPARVQRKSGLWGQLVAAVRLPCNAWWCRQGILSSSRVWCSVQPSWVAEHLC